MSNGKKPPATAGEALGRQYSLDSWSIGGMLAILDKIHDLWGVDVLSAQNAIREVKTQMTEVWKSVKE